MARFMVFAAAAAIWVLSGTGASAAGGTVSGDELRSLFPGQFEAKFKGRNVGFIAEPGGRLTGRHLMFRDTGRWRVNGSHLCITLASWFEGKTLCSMVVKRGPWYEAQGVRFIKH